MDMSKYTQYIQKQFENIKKTASGYISSDHKETVRPFIELDIQTYDRLKQIADAEHTTVEAIFNQAIEYYIALRTNQPQSHITLEQKENNPILYLDNISKMLN